MTMIFSIRGQSVFMDIDYLNNRKNLLFAAFPVGIIIFAYWLEFVK